MSGFHITAPAQSRVTDAVLYTAFTIAPAHQISAPAHPLRLMPVRVSGLVSHQCQRNPNSIYFRAVFPPFHLLSAPPWGIPPHLRPSLQAYTYLKFRFSCKVEIDWVKQIQDSMEVNLFSHVLKTTTILDKSI